MKARKPRKDFVVIVKGNFNYRDIRDLVHGMNLILNNSKDITEDDVKSLDKIIVRGDNIIMVSLPEKSNSLNVKDDA
jgi:DNA polymerase III alpha subunit (gram-positive type)